MQTDFIVTNKYKTKKHSSIVSGDSYIYGDYIQSKFSFLAYDPQKSKSLFHYLEEQLKRDNFEKYQDIVTF